jgi:isopenicillin N synthase-like dioxygenase
MIEQTIPVVDLARFGAGEADDRATAGAIGGALQDLGFFAVVNHGVDQQLIGRAYEAVREFFELPEEVKRRYEVPGLKGQRGFTSFGREHAKDHPAPDLKEFWHVGRELPAGHPLQGAFPENIWPSESRGFQPVIRELYGQLEACASRLLEATAIYLEEPRDLLREMARDGTTLLRIIHYPPVDLAASPGSMRAAPHEDINLITLLCESTAGGLEIMTREGEWRPVHAVSGQIIVDAGDMLQNLTNGLLRSTTHRVVNPRKSRERRFSMPFFVHPRPEVSLAPLPASVRKTGGTPRYPAITAGEYLLQRLREIGLAS